MSPHRSVLLASVIAALAGCAGRPTGIDLDGRRVDPLATPNATATVMIFVMADCPIANRFAPEIGRLHDRFAAEGVDFWLVYADPAATPERIREHMAEYRYACLALRDPGHALVDRAGATISPEAAVFTADGRLVYRGRINDRFVEWGRTRVAPTKHDLAEAVERVLDGEADELVTTPAVGCYLVDL